MPKPGDRFGDFVLLHELGRGAMGVVWAARQESLGREVALKVLGEAFAADPVWVARFQAEAGAAARLSHPGILPVYAVGTDQGLPWFAMEKVEGKDLHQHNGSGPRPQWDEIACWVRDAALALQHAHEQGVVHRDIKPANLMRRSDGRIVLTDFGLSKRIGSGSLTTTGLLVGTPYYMSPELVAGDSRSAGPPTDVYGLGVTLYELMTGRPPFLAENAVALIKRITDDEPEPPSRKDPRVPRDLETIALVCLEKRPEKRYPSAKDLADDLQRFLDHEPITRRRAGLGERLARVARRNRVAVIVAGVALLALGAVALFYRGQMDSREQEYRDQIARLLEQANALADAGEVDKAAEIERQAEAIGSKDADAARAHALEQSADFLRDLQAGREPSAKKRKEVEAWETGTPARLTLESDPRDVTVEGSRFVGHEERRVADLTLDGRDLTAGIWRLRVSAPGHLTTMLSVLAPPGLHGRLRVVLPVDDAAHAGTVSYGGAWFPSRDAAQAGSADGLEQALAPYLLDTKRVTLREYRAFVAAQPAAQRAALEPPDQPRRGPPRAPSAGEDQPITGLNAAQANAYAAWKGRRLPTDAELRNAAGPGRVPTLLAMAKRESGDDSLKRLVAAGRAVGRAIQSAEGLDDWDARPEWAHLTLGQPTEQDGRWPRLVALLKESLPEGAAAREAGAPLLHALSEESVTTLRLARSPSAP